MLRSELAVLLHSMCLMTFFMWPLIISLLGFCFVSSPPKNKVTAAPWSFGYFPLYLQLPNYKLLVLLPKVQSLAVWCVYKPICFNHINSLSVFATTAVKTSLQISPELLANISSCLLGTILGETS